MADAPAPLKTTLIVLISFSENILSKNEDKIEKLILIGTTYKRSDQERALVLDRYNQAKLNKPISKQALKRWFSDKYLEDNPKTYDLFMKILNKEPKDHKNFLKAYELFANHYDDFEAIKQIDRKTLVMTGSDDVGSTPAMSKELVKDLVNSTYIEIQNGKHLCSIECADDVNMNIKYFINWYDYLSKNLKKEADLTVEVDKSLIGGAKFRIENKFLDASIKSQLKNIKLDLMKI